MGDGFYECNAHFGKLKDNGDGSFTLREKDGFKQHFNDEGKLYCQEDRFGNEVNLYYSNRNTLTHLIDPYGRQTNFYHGDRGGKERLLQIVDFTGRTVDFHHTGNLLLGMTLSHLNTDAPPREERYGYNEYNLLNSITLPVEAASGGPPAVQCDYQQRLNGDWVVSSFHVGGTNASGVPAGGITTLNYNEDTVTCTDPVGGVLEYGFNDQNHLSYQVQYLSQEPFEIRTEFSQSNQGLLDEIIWPLGNSWEFTHDVYGNWITFTSVPDETRGGDPITWSRTFEPLYCQLASETDPRGNDPSFVPPMGQQSKDRYTRRWYFDYQEGGDLMAEAMDWGIDISAIMRAMGDVNGDGRTDQENGTSIWQEGPHVNLDPTSNLAQETGSTIQEINWYFQYNDWGQRIGRQDAAGTWYTCSYYPANDPDGDGQTIPGNEDVAPYGYQKSMTQDPEGLSLKTNYYYDQRGNQTGVTNPRGVLTRTDYNIYDEYKRIVEGADISIAIEMGELSVGTDALNHETWYNRNRNGWTNEIRAENPPDSNIEGAGPWIETDRTYDIIGNLVEEKSEIRAELFATQVFEYDRTGNLISETDPNGNLTTYQWDPFYRLVGIEQATGTPAVGTIIIEFDDNGNYIKQTNPEGGQTTFRHDGHDRITIIL